jgi:hypothetical protein
MLVYPSLRDLCPYQLQHPKSDSAFGYRHTRRNVVYYMQGANYTHSFGRIIGIFSASKIKCECGMTGGKHTMDLDNPSTS